jgi:hypothetical protein
MLQRPRPAVRAATYCWSPLPTEKLCGMGGLAVVAGVGTGGACVFGAPLGETAIVAARQSQSALNNGAHIPFPSCLMHLFLCRSHAVVGAKCLGAVGM